VPNDDMDDVSTLVTDTGYWVALTLSDKEQLSKAVHA